MDIDQPTTVGTLRCRSCHSENHRDAPRCWCCDRADWLEEDDSLTPPFPIKRAIARGVVILIGLVGLALFLARHSPIATVLLVFIVVPTFLISEVQALRCKRWGVPLSARDRLQTEFKCAGVLTPVVLFTTVVALLMYGVSRLGAYWFFWPLLPQNFGP
jgi:hypothetical protein